MMVSKPNSPQSKLHNTCVTAAVFDMGSMYVPAAVCTMRIQVNYLCLYVCYTRML